VRKRIIEPHDAAPLVDHHRLVRQESRSSECELTQFRQVRCCIRIARDRVELDHGTKGSIAQPSDMALFSSRATARRSSAHEGSFRVWS
jgi:hypothetical protein